jgi:hypothetical protein
VPVVKAQVVFRTTLLISVALNLDGNVGVGGEVLPMQFQRLHEFWFHYVLVKVEIDTSGFKDGTA